MYKFPKLIALIFLTLHTVCGGGYAQVINKVVAVVNDEVITQQDVKQILSVLYAQYAQEYEGDELLQKMEEAEKGILGQMIDDRLILSRAKELNIRTSEEEIKEKLQYIKNGFPSEEIFYQTLEAQGITVANLKARYRDQAMMRAVVNYEVKTRVSVLPSEISGYYEKNKELFRQKQKYKVRHILIKAEDEVGFELADVEMRNIYNKLQEGKDFSALAKRYSQGPNKAEGGDMGYIEEGEMIEELDRVIFSLKPGEFSKPIKTRIGYHIIKVEDIRHSEIPGLDEVADVIQKKLFKDKLEEKLDEWLNGLREEAYISIKE